MSSQTSLCVRQAHAWAVVVGTAAVAALMANVFFATRLPEPRFIYESTGGARCLVEEGSKTFVVRADGWPDCVDSAIVANAAT